MVEESQESESVALYSQQDETTSRERDQREPAQKIPRVLCDKFGDKRTRDFKAFEREFSDTCELYLVDNQKLKRLKLHLEGTVLDHAN